MNTLPIAMACVAIALTAQRGAGQIELPISIPPPPNSQGCPSFNTSLVSAAASRCDAMSRTANPFDGGTHLFATLGALGGHDSAFDERQNLPASFEGAVVYTGLISEKAKSFNLVENTASGMDYRTTQQTLQYLDIAAVSLTHLPSSRTIVTFEANNIFGNDAIRILDLSGATVSAESASYGIHLGRILDNQATFRVSQQSTDTRWWSASVRNNFRDFIDDHQQVNTTHGRAEIQFQPSARSGIGIFEETDIETGTIDCTAQSIGLVYERRISQAVAFEGSAAPTIGTKGCVSKYGANLYGALSAQPARFTTLWISAFRKLNDSQVTNLTYENNAQAGWMQRFTPYTWVKAETGWIGGTVAANTPAFRGNYVSTAFGHELPAGFTASVSFQYYNWAGLANVAPTRTLFTAGLYWTPNRAQPDQEHGPMAH